MTLEMRLTRAGVELRDASGTPRLVGYALKYQRYSQNLGGFVEQVAYGAVDKSLRDGADVLARYNHDDCGLLGRTASGTLRLSSDDEGLLYDVDLPDTQVGRDVRTLAARGDVYQSSFAFYTIEDEWDVTEQGFPLRTLRAINLVDVAPVNSPAYLDTSAAARSLASAIDVDPADVPRLVESGEVVRRLAPPAPVVVDVAVSADVVRRRAARLRLESSRP